MRYMIPILCSLAFSAHADSYLSLHVASDHSTGGDYNERNTGIGVEIDYPDKYWRVVVGRYNNSHGDMTTYLGPMYGTDRVAIGAMFLHGYDKELDVDRWWPSPAPILRIRPLKTKATPSFILAPISSGYVVLTSLDWRF